MSEFPIIARLLPYISRLETRRSSSITLAVIHCTELPDLKTARDYGEKIHYKESGTGNSGHFYIERSGRIESWVPIDRVAHHVRGYNAASIGIELDNLGRYPDWLDSRMQNMKQAYTDIQIEALIALLEGLQADCSELHWIAGHEDLDLSEVPSSDRSDVQVRRKRDPGPLFPWERLMASTNLNRYYPE